MRSGFAAALVAVVALATGADAISKITRSGRYLYDESGNRFYIKGIGYQPQGAGSVGDFGEPTDFVGALCML
jgi:1,3-beta-glucanosyltransferase GAS1